MTSGTPGSWRSQRSRSSAAVLGVVGDEHGPDVVGDRPADVDRLDDRPVDARDRDDDPLLAVRRREHDVVADRELAPRRVVLAVDEQHHPDEERDEDHDEEAPSAT